MTRAATAEINFAAWRHNLETIRRAAPHSQLLAVIKANGYGHGLLDAANALVGADAFAVAHWEEAIALRAQHDAKKIVLLEGFSDFEMYEAAVEHRIDCVIHCPEQLERLVQSPPERSLNVWLKIDTGMHRLGFDVDQFADVYQQVSKIKNINIVAIMSHFSCADEPQHTLNTEQSEAFSGALSSSSIARSFANSAAIFSRPQDQYEWIRPGIALYGISPFSDKSAQQLDLLPVMTLRSHLIAVKSLRAGQALGYGASWTASSDTKIGIVGIGYADGYPRHAVSGTPVLVNGRIVPLIGRVSMDMICVDLGLDAMDRVADDVTLWGEGLPVEMIANSAQTIAYELVCKVTSRVRFEVSRGQV